MKRNDCDDFPDTVIIGSSALYPLAKGATQMLILLLFYYYWPPSRCIIGYEQRLYSTNTMQLAWRPICQCFNSTAHSRKVKVPVYWPPSKWSILNWICLTSFLWSHRQQVKTVWSCLTGTSLEFLECLLEMELHENQRTNSYNITGALLQPSSTSVHILLTPLNNTNEQIMRQITITFCLAWTEFSKRLCNHSLCT